MVRPSFEDFVIGYMIYLKYHPDFPLNPEQAPPKCMNTNPFVDGLSDDLIHSRLFLCSVSLSWDSSGNIDFSPLSEDIMEPWRYICNNASEANTKFIPLLRKNYERVKEKACDESKPMRCRREWIRAKERIEKVCSDLDLQIS